MKRIKLLRISLIGIAAVCFLFFAGSLVVRYLTPEVVKPSMMEGKLYLYDDFSSSYNHYRIKAKISGGNQELLVQNMEENSKEAVYSGETSIRCRVDVIGESWGGWLFTYGYFGPFASEYNLNWGKHAGCGYDLTGAESLTFVAKGETGGEKVEFFFGGLGWDTETGKRTKSHADSTPKLTLGVVALTDEFKEYKISLANADLSYISSAFGFVVSGNYNQKETVFYLDDIKINFAGNIPAQPKKDWLDFSSLLPVFITAAASILVALISRNTEKKPKKPNRK